MVSITPEFKKLVDENSNGLQEKLQDIIDRMQYAPGFMEEMDALIEKNPSPYEIIEEDGRKKRVLNQN